MMGPTAATSSAIPWNQILASSGIGDILGGLGQMSLPNPADSAMPYLNQISGTISPYYQPYINAGNNAGAFLTKNMNAMANPNFINNYGKSFQQSPGYQFQVNQAMQGVDHAAAAGGMLGTPQEQQNMASTVGNLANQDYYNWMDHGLNEFNQSLGIGQNMFNTGFQASNNLATNLAQALLNQSNLAYAGQEDQNQQQGAGMGAVGQGVGNIFSIL